MPEVIPEQKARQGNRGRQVLYVLIIGLVLAAAAWIGVGYYGKAISPGPADNSSTLAK